MDDRNPKFQPALIAVLLAALLLAISPANAQTARPHASALAEFSAAVEELCASVSPAVVQIEVKNRAAVDNDDNHQTGFFAKQSASGSGVIVDASGYIVTNAHVIEASRQIDVSVADMSDPAKKDAHKHYAAKVVGLDKETDLAVLKIEADHLPTLSFLDSDTLKQGQLVFALGSPLGLDNTLTVGYVSATSRQLNPAQPVSYIQTDAPINPGNSGGPLLDIAGHVIGINTAVILPQKQTNGIGFAIPVTSHLVSEVNDLKQGREIVYGYLGVSVTEPTAHERIAAGAAEDVGVRVDEAEPNSPAAAAGIEMGDLIVKYNDQPIDGSDQFVRLVGESPVGKAVAVDLFRNGKPMTLMTTPRRRTMETLAITHDSERVHWRGMLLGPIPADWRNSPNKPAKGLVVFGIDDKSPMKSQGISLGSVITTIGGRDVSSVVDLLSVINETPVEKCNVQAVTPTTQPAKLTAVTASHNAQQ